MIYYANFYANNGTSLIGPFSDTNKKRIIKDVREMAEAERLPGNECRWLVDRNSDDGLMFEPVAEGGMTKDGKRYRIL